MENDIHLFRILYIPIYISLFSYLIQNDLNIQPIGSKPIALPIELWINTTYSNFATIGSICLGNKPVAQLVWTRNSIKCSMSESSSIMTNFVTSGCSFNQA